jgi:hypothetical protein
MGTYIAGKRDDPDAPVQLVRDSLSKREHELIPLVPAATAWGTNPVGGDNSPVTTEITSLLICDHVGTVGTADHDQGAGVNLIPNVGVNSQTSATIAEPTTSTDNNYVHYCLPAHTELTPPRRPCWPEGIQGSAPFSRRLAKMFLRGWRRCFSSGLPRPEGRKRSSEAVLRKKILSP